MELAKQSQGKLDALKGGQDSLDWYVKELNSCDLFALNRGVLCSQYSMEEVLNQISKSKDDPLRMQASQVLDRIRTLIKDRLADFWDEFAGPWQLEPYED